MTILVVTFGVIKKKIQTLSFEENLAVKILSISELEVEEEKINLTFIKNHDK